MYLSIKYIKSVLWSVAKHLSNIEDAWCLKVKTFSIPGVYMMPKSMHIRNAEYFNQRNESLLLETQLILEKYFNL